MDRLLHYKSHLVHNLNLGTMKNFNDNFDLKKNILVISPLLELEDKKILKLLDNGARFIYDHLWERPDANFNKITEMLNSYCENSLGLFGYEGSSIWKGKAIFVPMFFWFHEFIKTNSTKVNLPKKNKTHKFLMLINKQKETRALFIKMLGERLNESLYSLVFENKFLPNDSLDQRYYNPNWYDSTYFSLVVETHQATTTDIFLTEKTFKPIMYGHPFLLFAQPKSLDLLKRNGFKTYSNLFNENYDNIYNLTDRIEALLANIDNFSIKNWEISQSITQDNLDIFYNRDVVTSRLNKELIDPIINFVNEKIIK